MTQPITETEFRVLVDLRRAVGPPYAGADAVLNWPLLDVWVERFAALMEAPAPRSFDSLMWVNYHGILGSNICTPDHPREYYQYVAYSTPIKTALYTINALKETK